MLQVCEIFCSLQGEGIFTGVPTTFIRLQGCSLRCSYCDTRYAQNLTAGTGMMGTEVHHAVKQKGIRNVCLTGGEPLEQSDAEQLIATLLQDDFHVVVETAGHIPVGLIVDRLGWSQDLHLCVDYKLPSSGMQSKMVDEAFRCLRSYDSIKYVIDTFNDFAAALEHLDRMRRYKVQAVALFSPVYNGNLSLSEFAEEVVRMTKGGSQPARLSLQIHKRIWPEALRGV